MASKYLKAALATRASSSGAMQVDDPVLFKDRPALQEFMTLTVDDAGAPREPSCLMIAVRVDGIAVGLKSEEAGGWCWRTGDTLQKALNALEKALVGPEPAFRAAGSGRKPGARK